MSSLSLRSGRCLMLVLLLAPVLVRPKGLEFEDNTWTKSEGKREGGVFDDLADPKTKKSVANPAAAATEPARDSVPDRSLQLLDDNVADPSAAGTTVPDGSTGGSSHLMWAILASLCVAGVGLACFSYYWSHMRRVASW